MIDDMVLAHKKEPEKTPLKFLNIYTTSYIIQCVDKTCYAIKKLYTNYTPVTSRFAEKDAVEYHLIKIGLAFDSGDIFEEANSLICCLERHSNLVGAFYEI